MTMRPREIPWRKSSYSGGSNGACVEARLHGAIAQFSDSKLASARPILNVDPDTYRGFLAAVKADQFTS